MLIDGSTSKRQHTPSQASHALPNAGTPSTLAKTALVTLLSWLLAWRPAIAMRLGKLVTRVWRGFGRA